MPTIKVQQPEQDAVRANAREFALLHQLDPASEGFDAQKLEKYYGHGDEAKIKALAGKSDVSFAEFAEAFQTKGTPLGDDNCLAWAAQSAESGMTEWTFKRREMRPDDVLLQITYCGMCHSDLHQIRGEWGNSKFPMVPGHELMGVVVDTGKEVKKFKTGDLAAVGCMVDSCGECKQCKRHEEQYCAEGMVGTYNGKHKDGEITQGGYSTFMLCREDFVLTLRPNMHVPGTAPLLCAGITTYSPMKYYGIDKEGMKIGVVGCGGLGHMAVKFGKAFGQHVTVLSRSNAKREMALGELGADAYLVSNDEDAMAAAAGSLDAIIDTVSAKHDLNELLNLLDIDGKLISVGAPAEPLEVGMFNLLAKRRMIGGSLIGGIKETQEMLDFCADKGISCTCEVIDASYTNEAFDRMEKGDVHFRFVIDTLKSMVAERKSA